MAETVDATTEEFKLDSEILDAVKEIPLEADEGFNALVYSLIEPGSEVLKTPTKEWDFDDPPEDIKAFALNMVATMHHHGGVGLSANQVGFPYRIFAMKGAPPFVCINPTIVWTSDETVELEEGCLSFPGLVVEKINRPKHIRVRFYTPSGLATTKTFTGLTARVVQHEIEHLDGGFFFDGIGRRRMDNAMKDAAKRGYNYRKLNLMKRAITVE